MMTLEKYYCYDGDDDDEDEKIYRVLMHHWGKELTLQDRNSGDALHVQELMIEFHNEGREELD